MLLLPTEAFALLNSRLTLRLHFRTSRTASLPTSRGCRTSPSPRLSMFQSPGWVCYGRARSTRWETSGGMTLSTCEQRRANGVAIFLQSLRLFTWIQFFILQFSTRALHSLPHTIGHTYKMCQTLHDQILFIIQVIRKLQLLLDSCYPLPGFVRSDQTSVS